MIDKSNHGKVGKCLYIKMTPAMFSKMTGDKLPVFHGQILNVECLEKIHGLASMCPMHIDNGTQGDYEAVCEYGIEIREWE